MISSRSIDGIETLRHALDAMGTGTHGRYDLLLRDQRVLCALPQDHAAAMRTLELYQPQRWKGRLLKWFVRNTPWRNLCAPFLHTWWNGCDGDQEPTTNVGVMMGSSGHQCARAIAVTHHEDHWEVVKMAFGPEGGRILGHEAMMLRKLWAYPSVPEIRDFHSNGATACLRMTLQDGQPWRDKDITRIIHLLKCWQTNQSARPLASFAEWGAITAGLKNFPKWRSRAETWSDYRFIPSIRHGDLTRPNLRRSPSGALWVHDWERGTIEGVPGLDFAHFVVQDATFRSSSTPTKIIQQTLRQLNQRACKSWIHDIGWLSGPVSLLAATLAFNIGCGYFPDQDFMAALDQLEP